MKTHHILIFVLVFVLAACSNTLINDSVTDNNIGGIEANDGVSSQTNDVEPLSTTGPDCYAEGEHPIAVSIVEQYEQLTNYEEVMTWFCNGAIFEDILNALMTEEIAEVDADELLHMLAAGKTWNEIWLELGITEE